MIYRLSEEEIRKYTSVPFENISQSIKNEMAIPTYLHYNPLIKWLLWERYVRIARLGKFNKNMTVLEFGCGIGVFLPTLCRQCGEVFAIDLFPQYAKNLSKELNLTITFIENISDLQDEKLDLIIAADVMEHLEDPLSYIKILKDKLKGNGKLIVSGPTENSIYKIGRAFAGFHKFSDYHHTNIDNLKMIIKKNGFDLTKTITLPFIFPPYLFKVCEFIKS